VVKAFNAMFFGHPATMGRPRGASDRSALPIAGDDPAAKTTSREPNDLRQAGADCGVQ
jgi:predicted dinucleotide-binding enzyme